jgi:hypothetical protein
VVARVDQWERESADENVTNVLSNTADVVARTLRDGADRALKRRS